MPFSEEDKALVKNLHLFKGYGLRRLLSEFQGKNWTKGGLDVLLRKLSETGSTSRRPGSGRPKHGGECDGGGGACYQPRRQASDSSIDPTDIQRDWCGSVLRRANYSSRPLTEMLQEASCPRTDGSEPPCKTCTLKTVAEKILAE